MPVINVEGAAVAYAEWGAGAPVVLLHCTGASGAQWEGLAAALAGRYRLIAPDLHGHGGSEPWSGRGPMTLTDEAAIVRALAERVGEPVHLVGHSYGGAVALRAALDQPERVRSLVLVEPVSFHLLANDNAADELLFDEIQGVAEAIWYATASGDYDGGLACFVDYWNGPGTWARLRPDAQAALARRIGAIALNFWSATTDPARPEDCRAIAAPTLMLAGGRSPATTRRTTQLVAQAIPGAERRLVPDAGHMLPLTHRDDAAAAVAEHLARGGPALPRAA